MNDVIDLIDSSKPGVTEMDIHAAENELEAVLPKQYKELFKLSNQAQIGEWMLFPIKDPKNVKSTWDDIVRQNKEVRDERMARELISIGEDGTGDKLCFRLGNVEADYNVYIWYHETGEIEELALNLKEFIILYAEELDDE